MLKALMKKREEGFTLVELMIVVAIIGVLAALAIYGVARYLKHSKTAEATRNLGSLETGSKNAYQQETDIGGNVYVHQFCASEAKQPTATPHASKVKADYTGDGWKCLKFSINEPQFYAYTYSNNGSTGTAAQYTALANGDLDGNTAESTFQLIGKGGQSGDAERVSLTVFNEDE